MLFSFSLEDLFLFSVLPSFFRKTLGFYFGPVAGFMLGLESGFRFNQASFRYRTPATSSLLLSLKTHLFSYPMCFGFSFCSLFFQAHFYLVASFDFSFNAKSLFFFRFTKRKDLRLDPLFLLNH